MGSLRMKETPSERDAGKISSNKSEHRKKKRRKHSAEGNGEEQDGPDRPRAGPSRYYTGSDDDEDAYVPPRPNKDRPYVPYSFSDEDDESRLPPQSAHKRDKTAEEAEFNQRLFDAMREDEGIPELYSISGSQAGLSFDYRECLPDRRAFGASGVANDRFVDADTGVIVNRVIFREAMTEEEYAEHIRRGMFMRTRKEEVARLEYQERERKARQKRKAEEVARAKAFEAERVRKLEERVRRKAQAGTIKSREQYQLAWARLVNPTRAMEELRCEDFPWPVGPDSGGQLDKNAIDTFLTTHLASPGAETGHEAEDVKKLRKQAIRTAVLAYHPDRFEKYVLRVKQSQERESVRQMGCKQVFQHYYH